MKKCRSCGATILWAKTEAGKFIPVDAKPVGNGNLILADDETGTVASYVPAGEGTHVSHFATCPQAKGWRRKDGEG